MEYAKWVEHFEQRRMSGTECEGVYFVALALGVLVKNEGLVGEAFGGELEGVV